MSEGQTAPKTEGEMVLETLSLFQKQLGMMEERNRILEQTVNALNERVNKELPAQLDSAFAEIRQSFVLIGQKLNTGNPNSPLATATGQPQQQNGFMSLIENVLKQISGATTGQATPQLSEMDKEILKTTKQIQMISLKDVLKKTANSAGVSLVDHVVLSE